MPEGREPGQEPATDAETRVAEDRTRPAQGGGRDGDDGGATGLPATVRPFDPATLPALRRDDVRRLDGAAALVTPARLAAAERALSTVLGAPVGLEALGVTSLGEGGAPAGLGVVLTRPVPREGEAWVLVLPEPLVARAGAAALRREPPALVRPSPERGGPSDGAAAAVVAAALARHDGAPLWIDGVGDARALAAQARVRTRVDVAVRVGQEVHGAALLVGEVGEGDASARARAPAPRPRGAPCILHAVVAWGALDAASLAELAVGDVVLPGSRAEAHGPSDDAPLVLAGARATYGLPARLRTDGSVVLGSGAVALAAPALALASTPGASMPSPTTTTTPPATPAHAPSASAAHAVADAEEDALAQADVTVRVELGAVSLSAGEWSALVPGQVLALDRRPSDGVVLRAGGRAVARGELVTVDGELGVRIVAIGGAS